MADVNKHRRTWLTYRAVVEAPSLALHFRHTHALFIAFVIDLAVRKQVRNRFGSSQVHGVDEVVTLCRGSESCVVCEGEIIQEARSIGSHTGKSCGLRPRFGLDPPRFLYYSHHYFCIKFYSSSIYY